MQNYGRGTMDKKKLYAVLWVDDYGSLKLRKKDVEWYHKNAGPISYALECDDQFPWSFDMILNSKGEFSYDYLAHHYHPIKWKGARIPKKIYDSLRLYLVVHSILRNFKIPFSKIVFRSIVFLIFIATFVLISLTYFLSPILFTVLIALYAIVAGLVCVWYYVRHPKNWEYKISDIEWNKKFILKAREGFEKRGFEFPKIVRHGWNLPWKGSMEFYMKLGVMADASAVPVGVDSNPHIEDREIKWSLSQPYYTSLKGDYNIPWDGVNEEDKGLLELPVTLGNISAYGFGEKEKEIIEKIPDGGLVSVYIHPQDDFEPIKEWVRYLKENYDVRFVTALEAIGIYGGDRK